jgi:putative hydrolase of the HAD superfamily
MKFHNLVDKGGIDPLLIHRFRLENTLSKYDITWKDKYLNFYIDTLIKLTKPYEGILELLKFLKPMVTIGLISNAYDSKEQLARIEHSGIGHFFDEILISGSFGFSKPSPEIFQGMLNRFQIGADRAIFIGDSIKYDIQGAKSVGMKSILICQNKDFISDKAYFSCNSISELSCFLSALITNQIHQPDMTA